MVNFWCRFAWATGCQGTGSNTLVGCLCGCFQKRLSIWISGLSGDKWPRLNPVDLGPEENRKLEERMSFSLWLFLSLILYLIAEVGHSLNPALGFSCSQAFRLGLKSTPLALQLSGLLTMSLTFLGLQLGDCTSQDSSASSLREPICYSKSFCVYSLLPFLWRTLTNILKSQNKHCIDTNYKYL